MNIKLPEVSLVVLIGASGAGKSTFAHDHFAPTEILSSDFYRGLVSDDENDQSASNDAFAVLHYIAAKRLANQRLTVIDATNVQREARQPLLELARAHNTMSIAIVLDMPPELCLERNAARPERADMRPHVIRRHRSNLKRSLRSLRREGFRRIYVLDSPAAVADVTITREKLWNNRRDEHGPFDIIGDVHACFDELVELLEKLGYQIEEDPTALDGLGGYRVTAPSQLPQEDAPSAEQNGADATDSDTNGTDATDADVNGSDTTNPRRVIFLGDYVDRGPKPVETLRLVMSMVASGVGIALPGNHDVKLGRALHGRNVQRTHGLAGTMEALEQTTPDFQTAVREFIDGLVSHYVFDDGKLVVAHAGMKEEYAGRASGRVREFALYGETTGESDELGLPVRLDWAADYRGRAAVVYGHTPVPDPQWFNNTINIDTGCCFGGALTALRYPEREFLSVPARETYMESPRPLDQSDSQLTAQQAQDDMLDINDVLGKRLISTSLIRRIVIRQENAIAALEVMSRFAINPKWLIYLPPTMSPSATTSRPDLLEHPDEAFDYFQSEGIEQIICEEKHMGSRAVVVVCRDGKVATERFGVLQTGLPGNNGGDNERENDRGDDGENSGEIIGAVYTRTGRPFFTDAGLETTFLTRISQAVSASGLWDELETDWLCLDAELMPWSAKAQGLLHGQYAAVGAAAGGALDESLHALELAATNGVDTAHLLEHMVGRAERVAGYINAYRRYCWDVNSLDDLTLAPFHLLASEGAVHSDKDHRWHMDTLARLCVADEKLLLATPYRIVDVNDPDSMAAGIAWWEELTARGGEGMVVKPLNFVAQGNRGLVQPAVKCRGREYLRIIYGPEYTAPDQIDRLRRRGLGRKRSLAQREFALGLEALTRFVQREPLRRVHECVFGVLALESEPVDPRL